MIVPQARLLFWFALIALPFSALAVFSSAAQPVAAVLIVGLLLTAAIDAARAISRLDGIEIQPPPVARLTVDRPVNLSFVLTNPSGLDLTLRLGLVWPAALSSPHDEQWVRLPAGAERAQVDWPCLPSRRGRATITQACLETSSPLRLWAVRRRTPLHVEVRIYPNLRQDRKRLAALFLRRGAYGVHAQRQVGKGRDFEKLREYVPGDGFDEIHWKATARRGHPITKVFQIERTQEVYVVLDTSRLSARASRPSAASMAAARDDAGADNTDRVRPAASSILDRFVTAALILGQAAEQQGDLFGLITFAERTRQFLRASHGKNHLGAWRDALYTVEPSSVAPDFDEVASFLRTRLRRRALLIVLTSLEDPVLAEGFVKNMRLLAGQHLVLVNMLQPPGVQPLFTSPDVEQVEDLYGHLGGHLEWHRLRELEKVLERRGVRFSLLASERLALDLVTQYLAVKQRQLL